VANVSLSTFVQIVTKVFSFSWTFYKGNDAHLEQDEIQWRPLMNQEVGNKGRIGITDFGQDDFVGQMENTRLVTRYVFTFVKHD
jgi:hypothetical protein